MEPINTSGQPQMNPQEVKPQMPEQEGESGSGMKTTIIVIILIAIIVVLTLVMKKNTKMPVEAPVLPPVTQTQTPPTTEDVLTTTDTLESELSNLEIEDVSGAL